MFGGLGNGNTNGNAGTDGAAMAVVEAPAQPGALVIAGVDLGTNPFGLMDLNDADEQLGQSLPLRRIEYCASPDAKTLTAGWITDTTTRTQKQTIPACLVAVKFTRLLMSRFNPNAAQGDDSRRPICSSSNGTCRTGGTGAGAVEVEMKDGSKREVRVDVREGQSCVTCPYQAWPRDQKRPICSEAFNLLMADLEDGGTPFMLNIWHTGIKPLRTFRNALKAAALKVWRPTDGVPANLRVQFRFYATPEQRYYLPTFADLAELDLETGRRLARGLEPIIAAFNQQDTTEIATQDLAEEQDERNGGDAASGGFGDEPYYTDGNEAQSQQPQAQQQSTATAAQAPSAGGAAPAGRRFGNRG